VCCPACRGALACFVRRERATAISTFVAARADRAPVERAAFAPSPSFRSSAPLASRLQSLGGKAAPDRNRTVVIEEGLLICGECGRWFPILGTLPELLPDHLRDSARETPIFEKLAATLPSDVRGMLRQPSPSGEDPGARYKRAEIGVASKVEDPEEFFGPGYSAPFNPGNTEFSFYLISLFGNVIRLLGVDGKTSQTGVVVDSGCGYAWTAEWLAKSGIEAIGVDITRTYLEIGAARIGESRPHLVVGDVENMPIADGCAHAVLAYESFHHLPDRAAAMAGYARALRDAGVVVLAEPTGAHENADVSKHTMQRFGILEKGMELEDIEDYIAGLPFAEPEKQLALHISTAELAQGLNLPSAWRHSLFNGHIFRIRKDASRVAPAKRRQGVAESSTAVASAAPIDLAQQWKAELEKTIAELHTTRVDLGHSQLQLKHARETIDDMKRSAFWRARDVWVWLASLFGSDRGGIPPSVSAPSPRDQASGPKP